MIFSRIQGLTADMAPANFAMVMATGIVSLALHMFGYETAALALFWLNCGMFGCLLLATAARAFLYTQRFLTDAGHHLRGPGYFTLPAGACILGNQAALLTGRTDVAVLLFCFAVVGWGVSLWGVFFAVFINPHKPPLESGINGAWLVATVCTQGVVILGCTVAPHVPVDRELLLMLLTSLYGTGYLLYIIVITMIFFRFSYKPLDTRTLSPTFWINAGAVAITTLAGSELMLHAELSPFAASVLPFLKGMTVASWGLASWWIVPIFLLGFHRHVVQRTPFAYSPEYWGMVFPMGMYTVCTVALSDALQIPALRAVPEAFIFIAIPAWIATFYGLCAFLWRALCGTSPAPATTHIP